MELFLIGVAAGALVGVLIMCLVQAGKRSEEKKQLISGLQRLHDILYDKIVKQETYFRRFESTRAVANAYRFCLDEIDVQFARTVEL